MVQLTRLFFSDLEKKGHKPKCKQLSQKNRVQCPSKEAYWHLFFALVIHLSHTDCRASSALIYNNPNSANQVLKDGVQTANLSLEHGLTGVPAALPAPPPPLWW